MNNKREILFYALGSLSLSLMVAVFLFTGDFQRSPDNSAAVATAQTSKPETSTTLDAQLAAVAAAPSESDVTVRSSGGEPENAEPVAAINEPADETPPTAPKQLSTQFVSHDRAVIDWQPSTDDVEVVGYKIFWNSKLVADTPKTVQVFNGLTSSTTYIFSVVAYDEVGNISQASDIAIETAIDPETPPAIAPTPVSEVVEKEIVPTPIKVVVTKNPENLCGNATQDAGEECDDGNTNDNDMCLSNCQAARCGDGILNEIVEQCDDFNDNNNDYCTNQCLNYTPV